VLCEKPMGVTAQQAQQCVDVCKANSVSLTVAYYRRFWSITQAMLKYLRDGAIGQVVTARAQISDLFTPDKGRAWLTSREKSGGDALANAGAHWVDLIHYLLGDVASVMAYSSSKFSGWETDDTTTVLLQMENGALVSLISTRLSPVVTNELDIFGTEGRLFASPLSDGRLILQRRGHEPETMYFPRTGVVHSGLIAELIPRLLSSQPSPLPGEEAVAAWKIMQAAYRSSEEGVRILVN